MAIRLIVAAIFLAGIAAGLLAFRQERMANERAMGVMHGQVNDARRDIRTYGAEISMRTRPAVIRSACRRANLELEPLDAPENSSETTSTEEQR